MYICIYIYNIYIYIYILFDDWNKVNSILYHYIARGLLLLLSAILQYMKSLP